MLSNNAYGVAYVHEDETVKLGESVGWYAGIVHNTFKFKDMEILRKNNYKLNLESLNQFHLIITTAWIGQYLEISLQDITRWTEDS